MQRSCDLLTKARSPRGNGNGLDFVLLPRRVNQMYYPPVANDLDDIRTSTDCPVCGRELSVAYRTLRLGRTIECQRCGETIKLEDRTSIAQVQRLIDEMGDES